MIEKNTKYFSHVPIVMLKWSANFRVQTICGVRDTKMRNCLRGEQKEVARILMQYRWYGYTLCGQCYISINWLILSNFIVYVRFDFLTPKNKIINNLHFHVKTEVKYGVLRMI
jgi:hypothetical protein